MTITEHAIQRAKERLGWNAGKLAALAEKALVCGLTWDELPRSVRLEIGRNKSRVRVRGKVVFLFDSADNLITLLCISESSRKLIAKQQEWSNVG